MEKKYLLISFNWKKKQNVQCYQYAVNSFYEKVFLTLLQLVLLIKLYKLLLT